MQSFTGEIWARLRAAIQSWDLDFAKVRVYQDALPCVGDQRIDILNRIVDELADSGSANHQILQWLRSQGAQLMGTESTQLLQHEYELLQLALQKPADAPESQTSVDTSDEKTDLLKRRDQFIADRILNTLAEDETGILFIGILHNVEQYLIDRLDVRFPFGKPDRSQLRFHGARASMQPNENV